MESRSRARESNGRLLVLLCFWAAASFLMPLVGATPLLILDKAAVVTGAGLEDASPWRLCTVTKEEEELKTLLRMIPIWLTSRQLSGEHQDSRITGGAFSVPAASPISIQMMFSVASIALYNRFLGRAQAFTPLQLMRLGHATVALAACAQAGARQGWRGAHGH
ncbi:hypothetical protein HU200_050744 [Digitaria exilis]|uniref:Uncharacterized protein n=1 Tax=Digitaria exilis TaxID=1010633 RepID=A0A835EA03_9POAL|nr:hypothetical protein HU200_050744 [Digitaria exilis]